MAIRAVLALILFVSATSFLPAQSGDSPHVIRDVRVFDGETVAERRTVVISEGRVAAVGDPTVSVPAGAQEIAGDGRTLLPGLMDAHMHLPIAFPAEALQQTLAFGVTTAVVMWADQPTVSRLKEFEAAGRPDVAAVLRNPT
jgi:imidazolonepropionase-like amidohydrolase